MSNKNLILKRKFWPVFWTQFLGAFNDNLFKNAMVILITFKSYTLLGFSPDQMVALCGGIFILPFFLFSSLAGQCADKFSKSSLITYTKFSEILIMIIGSVGFLMESVGILFVALFLMGLQSTVFGPVKYSILPELLDDNEIVQGNAEVELGTFLSILLGTIAGGLLISLSHGAYYLSATTILLAILGLWTGTRVLKLPPVEPALRVDFNLFSSTLDIISLSRKTRSVFISILGISWFWLFGAMLLSIFPVYVKNTLYGNEGVVTLFLALFSIGVGIGSIICEKASHERVELGLVPFGSIGMCLFVLHLYFIGAPYEDPGTTLTLTEFLAQKNSWLIVTDLLGLSIMSGFFIVPLYTFIQVRSERTERSRIIAANNILNALFMVIGSLLLMGLFALNLKVHEIFLVLFVLSTAVSIYIYTVIPEFLWRFIAVIIGRIIYKLNIKGNENIPNEGPGVLIANHVSFVDWLLIAASVKRPVRFVMHYSFMKIPFMSFLMRGAKVIPIAGAKEDPKILEEAFEAISQVLKDGELVCIFPEGKITHDGKLSVFRPGIEKILERDPVPVIPMVIRGMWGSFFSRKYGSAFSRYSLLVKNFRMNVDLLIGNAWDEAGKVQASEMEVKIQSMLNE
ncbi:MAG: MFS transporter [Bacteriovoracia bacterium]